MNEKDFGVVIELQCNKLENYTHATLPGSPFQFFLRFSNLVFWRSIFFQVVLPRKYKIFGLTGIS